MMMGYNYNSAWAFLLEPQGELHGSLPEQPGRIRMMMGYNYNSAWALL
jgi:hypothetical protein